MGNTDNLPVISQTKSLVQAITGDNEGALQTQQNFVKGCPVISQGVALVTALDGDKDYALESQKYFLQNVSNIIDATPIIDHAKGVVHYACGDKEGGENAMKAGSRTVGVATGGVSGFCVGGPVGAVLGGVTGGMTADTIISGVDSAIHGKKRLYGHLYSFDRAIDGNLSSGEAFDWAITPVFDGLTGYAYGKTANEFITSRAEYNQFKNSIKQAIRDGKLELKDGQTLGNLAREIQKAAKEMKAAVEKAGTQKATRTTSTMVIDMEGNPSIGYSFRLRQALNIDGFEGGPSSTQQILQERFPDRTPRIMGGK